MFRRDMVCLPPIRSNSNGLLGRLGRPYHASLTGTSQEGSVYTQHCQVRVHSSQEGTVCSLLVKHHLLPTMCLPGMALA